MFPGFGVPNVFNAPDVAISYKSNWNGSNNTSQPKLGQSIGSPTANRRRRLVLAHMASTGGTGVTSASISSPNGYYSGLALTQDAFIDAGNTNCSLWSVLLPESADSDTTVDFDITCGSTAAGGHSFAYWIIENAFYAGYTDSSFASTSATKTLSFATAPPNNAVIIAVAFSNSSQLSDASWTGITEQYDVDTPGNAVTTNGVYTGGHLSVLTNNFANNPITVTWTAANASYRCGVVCAYYGPNALGQGI